MNNVNLFATVSVNPTLDASYNYIPEKIEASKSFQDVLDTTKSSIDNIDRNINSPDNSDKENGDVYSNNVENEKKRDPKDIEKTNTLDNKDEKKVDKNNLVDDIYLDIEELSNEDNEKDIKNIKELLAKLTENVDEKYTDDSTNSKLIETIKSLITDIEKNENIEKDDKDSLKEIMSALSIISDKLKTDNQIVENKETLKDILSKEGVKKTEANPKEEIKNIKEAIENTLDKIEKSFDKEMKDSVNETAFNNIENETSKLLNNKAEKNEKVKVESNGRIDSVNEKTNNNDNTEITIVKMKDSVDDVQNRLNANDNNIKTDNANKTNSLENLKNFNEMMSKLVDKAKVAMSEGRNEVVMTLKPEKLGDVRLKIYLEGDDVNAKIFVDNAEIKDLFTKNIDTVIKSLSEANISVGGFDVMLRDDMPKEDMEEFRELIEKGSKTSHAQKQNEAEATIKTIERYALPERVLDLIV